MNAGLIPSNSSNSDVQGRLLADIKYTNIMITINELDSLKSKDNNNFFMFLYVYMY